MTRFASVLLRTWPLAGAWRGPRPCWACQPVRTRSVKIGFSLGCPKNLVDSEVMLGLAQQQGHELTSNAAAPTPSSSTPARSSIGQAGVGRRDPRDGRAQEDRPCRTLIVTGCMAERYRDELRQEIPEIDALLGTGEVPDIVEALRRRPPALAARAPIDRCYRARSRRAASARRRPSPPVPAPRLRRGSADLSLRRRHAAPAGHARHYAYLKIAEGCDYTCAFCIIPTLRGHYRSRSLESIVDEARRWPAAASASCCSISQDTSFYGVDRGERGALPRCSARSTASTGWSGSACSTCTRRRSPTTCSTPWPRVRKVCATSTCRCSTRRIAVLKRMKRPGTRAATNGCWTASAQRMPDVDAPHHLHRRLPGRDRAADFDELLGFVEPCGSTTSASSPTPTRRARRPSAWPTTCRRPRSAAPARR